MNDNESTTQNGTGASTDDQHLATDGGEDTLFITAGRSSQGTDRRLHTDADCHNLETASTVREAIAIERERHEVCKRCRGVVSRETDYDFSYQRALRAAAEDGDEQVRTDGGRKQCVVCAHPYDRDAHDRCPNCDHSTLEEFATDGGLPDTVYVTNGLGNCPKTVHLFQDCVRAKKAKNVYEKDPATLFDDIEICENCKRLRDGRGGQQQAVADGGASE